MYNNYGNSYATLKMCHFSCQLFINTHSLTIKNIHFIGHVKNLTKNFKIMDLVGFEPTSTHSPLQALMRVETISSPFIDILNLN